MEKVVAPNGEILNIRTPAEQAEYAATRHSMPSFSKAEGSGIAGQSIVDGKAFTSIKAAEIYDLVKSKVPQLIELGDGEVVAAEDIPDLIDDLVRRGVEKEMRLMAIREEQAAKAMPFTYESPPDDALDSSTTSESTEAD